MAHVRPTHTCEVSDLLEFSELLHKMTKAQLSLAQSLHFSRTTWQLSKAMKRPLLFDLEPQAKQPKKKPPKILADATLVMKKPAASEQPKEQPNDATFVKEIKMLMESTKDFKEELAKMMPV